MRRMPRPIEALIHPAAMAHNLGRARAAQPDARLWAVVKADAYGHGIARAFKGLCSADGFALLDLDEAQRLRDLGWRGPILLLEGAFEARDLELCSRLNLWHVVHCAEQIDWLAAHDRAQLEHWRVDFMRTKIMPLITAPARALVEQHRTAGDTLLIITATNRFITAPIATVLGIEHLIATEPEEHDGRFTGRVAGVPAYREGKVTRLDAWLQEHSRRLDHSWFYSDSHNDLPLLNRVSHPVAVNPDPMLSEIARARGWPIISLR